MGMFLTDGSAERIGILTAGRQATIAAAGSGQTDATTAGGSVSIVTAASGANGVIVAKAKIIGRQRVIYSSAATNALLVYPPVGGTINNGTINAALSLPARKPVYMIAIDNTGLNWIANISA